MDREENHQEYSEGQFNIEITEVQRKDGSFIKVPLVVTGLTFPALIDNRQMFISGVSIEGTLTSDGEIEMPDADLFHLGYGGVEHLRKQGDRLISVEATLSIHRVSFGYQDQEGIPGIPTAR